MPGEQLAFRTKNIGQPFDVTLRPFYSLYYNYQNVYWDVLSDADWTTRAAELRKAEEQRRKDEARTVDVYQPGEQQSEVDHDIQSDKSKTGDAFERKWRDASNGGWFEIKMRVAPGADNVLRCTYWGGDTGNREFEILADGEVIGTQILNKNKPNSFFDVDYPLPSKLLNGKSQVTIRVQAKPGKVAGGLFGAAMMKAAQGADTPTPP